MTNLLVSVGEMRDTRQPPARRNRGWSMEAPEVIGATHFVGYITVDDYVAR
jgi:hypothetical protein